MAFRSSPNHYLNQTKIQLQNTKPSIHENANENIVCAMAAILSAGDELMMTPA